MLVFIKAHLQQPLEPLLQLLYVSISIVALLVLVFNLCGRGFLPVRKEVQGEGEGELGHHEVFEIGLELLGPAGPHGFALEQRVVTSVAQQVDRLQRPRLGRVDCLPQVGSTCAFEMVLVLVIN